MNEYAAHPLPIPPVSSYQPVIDLALEEDIASGDITTGSMNIANTGCEAAIICKQAGIVAGLFVASQVFHTVNASIRFEPCVQEGCSVEPGDILAHIEGPTSAILVAERTSLNFLQRLSGIATLTRNYTAVVQATVAKNPGFMGRSAPIIKDTRKTCPGHRSLDKFAVLAGGGSNHRFGLYDMVLIKDNHIAISGGIAAAVEMARRYLHNSPSILIEVETSCMTQVQEAMKAEADIIMLDNFGPEQVIQAVELIDNSSRIEVSGGININTVSKYVIPGVDYISVGELTHSPRALDMGLNFRFRSKEICDGKQR